MTARLGAERRWSPVPTSGRLWARFGTIERGEAAVDDSPGHGARPGRVRVALRYHGTFPDEVDLLTEENQREADEAYAGWQAAQRLLK